METLRRPDPRRVVVIGPCASGKTSLTTRLQRLGYDAHACGQEHSDIPTLWQHQQPDLVIGLSITLDTLRARRRSDSWSGQIFSRQMERLRCGFDHADLMIDCNDIDQQTVLDSVLAWMRQHPPARG